VTKAVDDDRVLREAARLFRRHGFASTTVRQIAKASRMLPGSLHYRYATKDDVLTAVLDRGVEKLIAELNAVILPVGDPFERLRVGFGRYLEILLEGEDALFVMLFDWRALPPGAKTELDVARGKLEAYWDGLLVEAWATGKSRQTLDLALLRNIGVGAANWTATWYRKEDGRTPRQIADAFWAYLSYGLIDESARPKDFAKIFERK
jgi:TetR/AcrR family transcriptional regulator, cholesterol catabolism regulator